MSVITENWKPKVSIWRWLYKRECHAESGPTMNYKPISKNIWQQIERIYGMPLPLYVTNSVLGINFHATMAHIKTCAHVGTLQVWPCARSLRTEMLQKSLRSLTRTTFLLTPKAVSATLLLKMNREVFNVAHLTFDHNLHTEPASIAVVERDNPSASSAAVSCCMVANPRNVDKWRCKDDRTWPEAEGPLRFQIRSEMSWCQYYANLIHLMLSQTCIMYLYTCITIIYCIHLYTIIYD